MGQTWITVLRGVNVGGQGKLPMAAFRETLARLGYGNVRTYIQSGNAVFAAPGSAGQIEAAISDAVETEYGFRRPVIALSLPELEAALAANPFNAEAAPKTLHFFFLRGDVQLDEAGLRALCDQGEEFALMGGVFFLYTPNGFGKSKASARIDRFLKAGALTARNLSTVKALAEMARGA